MDPMGYITFGFLSETTRSQFLGKNNKEEKEEDTGEITVVRSEIPQTTRHLCKKSRTSWGYHGDIYDIIYQKKSQRFRII